ncbi:TetR/AcrR family transcriptional regulator [Vibrio sp. 1CM24A]|jgi:AcrR family transcriptional regulator|uniref:TetR/AcrR family transcriptional regulator n=1 Tax=Vibrio sp. 1CM24A TaxID=2929165 RepID=UPI0020BD5BEE|nr:TetR/AcrR family transcriptional regulator [Vibrio sp. 1CM24A]MCK8083656.1 TetR/AcrR family transcriptional regulator [Vibrio sp. 1CM24A]
MIANIKKQFDTHIALELAMKVFWENGYSGTSVQDLTSTIGITKPSLYNAFGNKESLFVLALKHYLDSQVKNRMPLLNDNDLPLEKRLKNYMMSIVDRQCCSGSPKGCMVVMCQPEALGKNIPEAARIALKEAGEAVQLNLKEFFLTDKESILAELDRNATTNALIIATTLRGTASMACTGRNKKELEIVVDHCLKSMIKSN